MPIQATLPIEGCTDCAEPCTADAYGRCPDCSVQCTGCEIPIESGEYCADCRECSCCVYAGPRTEFDSCGRCEDCHVECDSCGADAESVDELGYCDECHGECDDCHTTMHREDLDEYGRCTDCTVSCAVCGLACSPDESEEGYCSDCSPSNWRQPYSYRPLPLFHRLANERPRYYLGFELEMDRDEDDADAPDHDAGELYFKQDGSLSPHGAEAVSHPCSFAYLRHTFGWQWLRDMRKDGWTSYNSGNCGLHIHVSKSALPRCGWYRIFRLFEGNHEWALRISRRSRREFERWCDPRGQSAVYKAKSAYAERYEAWNAQPAHTMECRLFRGTMHPESLWANVCLVVALVEWSRQAGNRDGLPAFLDYLASGAPRSDLTRPEARSLYTWANANTHSRTGYTAEEPSPCVC